MFSNFFYICKAKGLNITLSEWLTLQEALDKGLCEQSDTVLLPCPDDSG